MMKNSSWHHTLKHERQLRGWSQADVADRIGSDPKTVSRWEQGFTLPRPYFQQRLVDLFGKDAQALGFIAEQGENFRDTPTASDDLPSQRAWEEIQQSDHRGEGPVTTGWLPNLLDKSSYPLSGRERDLHHLLAALQDPQGALVLTLDGVSEQGKTTKVSKLVPIHVIFLVSA